MIHRCLTGVLALLVMVPVVHGATMCESHYEAAVTALADSALDRGSSRKLMSHVDNAWRMSGCGYTAAAVHQLDSLALAGSVAKLLSGDTCDEE